MQSTTNPSFGKAIYNNIEQDQTFKRKANSIFHNPNAQIIANENPFPPEIQQAINKRHGSTFVHEDARFINSTGASSS
jgi:hypothetical protein